MGLVVFVLFCFPKGNLRKVTSISYETASSSPLYSCTQWRSSQHSDELSQNEDLWECPP